MAQTRDLGNGFRDHGVAAPVARSRGAAATVDGDGNNVILVYLSDHRACMSLLTIDARTGESRQVDVPPHNRDSPFAVILSSKNHFLTHFGTTFMDFDPASGTFAFHGKTKDRVAMSMTEDHRGIVWAATYPKSHVVSYDPVSGDLTDHGSLNQEKWPQYPRSMAVGRDGWVYIASVAPPGTKLSLDGAPPADAVISHEANASDAQAMRHLKQGEHTINIHGDGAIKSLTVRAIPEMIFDSIGYRPCPWLKCYGPYNWDLFEKCGIMDAVNVIAERAPLPENAERSAAWQADGKRILWASFVDWKKSQNVPQTVDGIHGFLADHTGLKKPHLDGTLMSEFDGFGYPRGLDEYPIIAKAIRRMGKDPKLASKVFYPYGKFMYLDDRSIEFMAAILDSGYKFAEEIYMQEKPTEQGARNYLDAMVRQRMLRYQAVLPDCQKGMIAVLAYFSIPRETVNVDPNANYMVFMDMQMNLLANDPVFSQLAGVMWYHCAYADEQSLAWSARLLRHYCIEGRRDMLSTDPYELTHIENADFRLGTKGWTITPAEPESTHAQSLRQFGGYQGRYPRADMGDQGMLTIRSAAKPNRFSQRVKHLKPGRLYSVKMFSADYNDMAKGIARKAPHAASITLEDVDILPQRSICELFSRGGGSYAKEGRKSNRWVTFREVFFRPRKTEAQLIISDWESDTKPGGPVGQSLIHNFIELEPYLDQ
ncbi:MAG: hypothetical protein HQ546_04795 [Planctomycetes bacterium]|nr:hypothetical protein [Planctomycetota bacterium]